MHVIPAKAGTHDHERSSSWVQAFAGMTISGLDDRGYEIEGRGNFNLANRIPSSDRHPAPTIARGPPLQSAT